MKIAGIIGGIAPDSTVDYYRSIIAGYRERTADGSYPAILIDSIDMQRMLHLVATDRRALAAYLANEVERLARAGAAFVALAANTPHVVFDDVRHRSPTPLVSIVDAACEAAKELRLRRLALLGTRFTMEGRFYPEVFSAAGIALVRPAPDELSYVHERYMDELVKGAFLPETRTNVLEIVARMRQRDGVDGVILAGTELPLLLRDADAPVPFLDTTRLHVRAILDRMLEA